MLHRAALALFVVLLGLLVITSPRAPAQEKGKAKGKRAAGELPKELTPKPFTFKGKDISLAQALAELKKQTGNPVEDRRQVKDETKINLDVQGVSFWQGLDAIAKAADCKLSLYEMDGKVALTDGPHQVVPVCYSGIFRIAVKRLQLLRFLDQDTHTLTVNVEVAWEPHFRPLLMETRTDSLEVVDDKGRTVEIPEADRGMGAVGGKVATETLIKVGAPQRSAGTLQKFKGKLAVVGPGRMTTFTFDNLDKVQPGEKAPKQTRDGVTVTLRQAKLEGMGGDSVLTTTLVLDYPGGGPRLESFQQSFVVSNEIYLEKEKDGLVQRFPPNLGYDSPEGAEDKAIINYRFGDEPEKKLIIGKLGDWKLVYRTPGRMIEVPVEFEFKDIPLP